MSTPRKRAPRAGAAPGAPRRTPRKLEQLEHAALAQFLRETAVPRVPALRWCYHTANESSGGKILHRRRADGSTMHVPLDVVKNARMGVVAGVWDWLLWYPNVAAIDGAPPLKWRGLAIELKSESGRLSDEQKLWREHYVAMGWQCVVFKKWHLAAAYLVRWVGGDVRQFQGLE